MNGLRFQLVSNPMESNNSLLTMFTGFTVYVTENSNINTQYTDGVNVPLGFSTNIAIKKVVINKKEKPYSECIFDLSRIDSYPSQIFKTTFVSNNNSYSLDKCVDMCVQLHIVENCGCYDIGDGVSPDPSLRPCMNDTDLVCDTDSFTSFVELNVKESCDCPQPCIKTKYETKKSLANFPSRAYADYLMSNSGFRDTYFNGTNLTFATLKGRIAAVNVFFNELSETTIIEKSKMSFQDVISDTGGVLGLFLGNQNVSFFLIKV
jgi:hypothetical protein